MKKLIPPPTKKQKNTQKKTSNEVKWTKGTDDVISLPKVTVKPRGVVSRTKERLTNELKNTYGDIHYNRKVNQYNKSERRTAQANLDQARSVRRNADDSRNNINGSRGKQQTYVKQYHVKNNENSAKNSERAAGEYMNRAAAHATMVAKPRIRPSGVIGSIAQTVAKKQYAQELEKRKNIANATGTARHEYKRGGAVKRKPNKR